MFRQTSRCGFHSVVVAALLLFTCSGRLLAADGTWKAGAARTVMTPAKPMWMAGYGSRDHVAEGKQHDLYIRALALEDAAGHRAVVVSTDTVGIQQSVYENTCRAVKEKFGLDRPQIMINASHTHCGPVLRRALYDAYPLDEQQLKLIEEYTVEFEGMLVKTIGDALDRLAPASVSVGQGSTDFAVNRRENTEADVPRLREQEKLKGPVDHSIPVLAAHSPEGKLLAVVFGYACHNTTLSYYKWCGDYAGFAQLNLEVAHPDAVAMFYMGCGADQNPLPRRTVELAQKYGTMLSSAVDETLAAQMKPLKPTLHTEFEMLTLNLGAAPTREELTKMAAESPSYLQRWASRLLKEMDAGNEFIRTYPYPVQAWFLGGKQLWISLGGEVVVDYSLAIKKELGGDVWVTGYANDVMAYIPSVRVLDEGRYEGNTSMMVYGLPAHRWGNDIEELILGAVRRVSARARE